MLLAQGSSSCSQLGPCGSQQMVSSALTNDISRLLTSVSIAITDSLASTTGGTSSNSLNLAGSRPLVRPCMVCIWTGKAHTSIGSCDPQSELSCASDWWIHRITQNRCQWGLWSGHELPESELTLSCTGLVNFSTAGCLQEAGKMNQYPFCSKDKTYTQIRTTLKSRCSQPSPWLCLRTWKKTQSW